MTRAKRTVGRPRSLTMARIVDAAIELGLKELNMKALAAALGVNVVTLYRHVGSRHELMRIAIMHLMMQRRLDTPDNEHWAQFAMHYAVNLFEVFRNEPGLLIELINGNLQPHSEIDVLEEFLQAMADHGFSFDEGVRLHRSIGAVVLGNVAGTMGITATLERGSSWEQDLQQALDDRDESELPAIRQALPTVMEYDPDLWLKTLHTLFTGVAFRRGESLPDYDDIRPATLADTANPA